ncbi:putative Enoyl reductase (ER) domain-containing protein [Seiridium cardinale]|uniref:Enoyl reductase (ER) domain-containing protein n=1 Tax=Seiridium cardinale TaxID=138064 RepID=A0ABR2XMG4_9PEZI
MASNKAAYLVAVNAPLEVKSAPYPEPKEFEIVVKSRAVAINPVDYFMQLSGPAVFPWLQLPSISGYDVAGEVSALGSGITKFKVGDRVAGTGAGAFQEYVPLKEHMVTTVPESISFEQASVLPMCLAVAVKALFHPEYLALDPPKSHAKPNGNVVIVWGGSTSVGSNLIQLARAAGYEVITTASPSNFDYVKKLGATQAFDYKSLSVKDDLLAAVKGKKIAGTVANGGLDRSIYQSIVETLAAVVLSSPDHQKLIPLTMVPNFSIPEGVETKFVVPLEGDKDVAAPIFNDYLPGALADGSIVPAPEAQVTGKGLESIQEAYDVLKNGVSAKKIVVTI